MIRIVVVAAVAALSLIGCGAGSSESAPSTVTVRETVTAPSAAAADTSWTMPNLIGRNLQDAQDAIQSLTDGEVFFSGSTDLTGQGRNQVLDRNWQVCTSTPAPGETFTQSTNIDFGVVRIDSESCP